MPSSAWKMRKVREKWLAGDTVSVAIGQGYLTVTPLQLAHAIGGIVTGGVWQIPHLEKGQASTKRPPRAAKVSLDNVQKVVNGMCGVVQHGTATAARIPGVELCGKTGTSQLISNETLELRGLKGKVVDNAWFVGFAPRTNAEIVVVALYEAGLHGDRASLLVRDVTKAYFDKKQRRNVPVTLNPAPEDPHGPHEQAPGAVPSSAPIKPASAGAEL
jgi:penicillin-binding protein 2